MERVTGIGGVFFRARDPEALSRWYRDHLGVAAPPSSYDEPTWWQQEGPTVFAAMGEDSPHFGRLEQRWSINFRVADLDTMITQLTGSGISVGAAETHPNGRFAELADPEGNPIQLWEPNAAEFDRSRPA